MLLEQVLEQIYALEAQHVVITGGEPFIQKQLGPLTNRLHLRDYHITIETAGTVFQKVECDLISISPKMSNSTPSAQKSQRWHQRHESERLKPEIVRQLITAHEYQLKFVVDRQEDIEEIEEYLKHFAGIERTRVLLMPQGVDFQQLEQRGRWVAEACSQYGFTFCPRKHIEWYGNQRGT